MLSLIITFAVVYNYAHMTNVSFLIDASSPESANLRSASSKLPQMTQGNLECVFYNAPSTQWVDSRTQFIGESPIGSLKESIATAAGDWVVFCGVDTMISAGAAICTIINKHANESLIAPIASKGPVLRRFECPSFVAMRKSFAISQFTQTEDIAAIVKSTDIQLQATFVRELVEHPNSSQTPFKTLVYVKPFKSIVKSHIKNKLVAIEEARKRARADKLSKNVHRVVYSNDIPVFIINRDRYEPLKKLVKWLEDEGLQNIHIVDNASTYPPLIEYYEETSYHVIRLNYNSGHTSPWKDGVVQLYAGDGAYIVTDPDIVPSPGAHGAVRRFAELLNTYLERRKVGFGLRIDNIPDSYELKSHVIAWEKKFWESELERDVYDAEIDTTFALYRPGTPYVLGPALRTGGEYVAEHEPWYTDSANIPEEIRYYRKYANKVVGSWGASSEEKNTLYEHTAFVGK